jgi:DNA-binding MarR family transcriptional regulator
VAAKPRKAAGVGAVLTEAEERRFPYAGEVTAAVPDTDAHADAEADAGTDAGADAGADTDLGAATESLMTASRLMTAVVARTLAEVDRSITIPQLRVLVMLYYGAPMNLTSIADGLAVNASNASRTCDKLARGGLLVREEDPEDRRHLVVTLTATGRRVVGSVMDGRRAILREIVDEMSAAEQQELARGLDAFLRAADVTGVVPSAGGSDSIIPWAR